jgi:hypothetical protein
LLIVLTSVTDMNTPAPLGKQEEKAHALYVLTSTPMADAADVSAALYRTPQRRARIFSMDIAKERGVLSYAQ